MCSLIALRNLLLCVTHVIPLSKIILPALKQFLSPSPFPPPSFKTFCPPAYNRGRGSNWQHFVTFYLFIYVVSHCKQSWPMNTRKTCLRFIKMSVWWHWDHQTLKSIKINSSKNRQRTIYALVPQHAEPRQWCFELKYSESKITKIFWGFTAGPHWGGVRSCTMVFALVMLV